VPTTSFNFLLVTSSIAIHTKGKRDQSKIKVDSPAMESAGNKRKAKNKQWFKGQKRRKFSLGPDLRGFLCFCNHKEKEAIREAYNILNQHHEEDAQGNGKAKVDVADASDNAVAQEDDLEEDIEAQLEREKSALKDETTASEYKRFQVIESGVQNVLFIRTEVSDPLGLVTKILEGIQESKKQVTRHLIRMLPIQATCKAYEQNVRPALESLVDQFVAQRKPETQTKYQVLFKARMNQNLFKEDVLKIVQEAVKDKNFRADLKNPDVCFVFEVLKSNCCLSILPNYFQLKKYNLIELAQSTAAAAAVDDHSKVDTDNQPITDPESRPINDSVALQTNESTKQTTNELSNQLVASANPEKCQNINESKSDEEQGMVGSGEV